MPDAFLDAAAIRASTFVRHVEIHDTLGSTNDRAIELARNPNIELPALIAARRQTAGRGRGKNAWHATEGSLTFSILLEPLTHGIGIANWPQLSLVTATAVCDALTRELNPQSAIRNPQSAHPLAIKWPNDVMLNDAKLCGILIESPGGAAPAKNRAIIGIGINVNNSWHHEAPDIVIERISCRDFSGHSHDLEAVLIAVLKALAHRLSQLAENSPTLSGSWQMRSWLNGRNIHVETDNGRILSGTCMGIDRDGALLIQTAAGVQKTLSGSVSLAAGV